MAKIMVVDDEPDIRHLVKIILQKEGHTISEAQNGTEALEKLKKEKPDLILLDVMMPGIDGWETLELIRKQKHLKSIPISMFTVESISKETLAKVDNGGLIDYIQKPFTMMSLKNNVNGILKDRGIVERRFDTLRSAVGDGENLDMYKFVARQERLHKSMVKTLDTILSGGFPKPKPLKRRTNDMQSTIILQKEKIEMPTEEISVIEIMI